MDPQPRKSYRLGSYTDLSKVETAVFWNMAECPIPEKMDIGSLARNITKSLNGEGFNGRVTVYAFDDIFHYEQSYLEARVFPLLLRRRSGDPLMMILSRCLCWALSHPAPANILLIVKDIEERDEFTRAFDLVTRKRYNCMLAQQVDSEVLHHYSVDRAWLWGTLSSGGPALSPRLDDAATSSSSHSQGVSALQEQVSANDIEGAARLHLPP